MSAASEPSSTSLLLEQARRLASTGQDEAAKAAYLELLRRDPTHFSALNELGTVALATGHRSAALTAYRQAVLCHPGNPVGRVNLGNMYFHDSDFGAARQEYQAALGADPGFAEAHQGLARVLEELGEKSAAAPHWEKGFAGRALVPQRYRGTQAPVRALLLVSARFGNVATQLILDDRIFETVALFVDFYDPAQPLPPHALVFNAIGDADLCGITLERAEALLAGTRSPVINAPNRVRRTGRVESARRLGALPGVIAPAVRPFARGDLEAARVLSFPLLVRSPGYHMGSHFLRVERREDLPAAVASLPGDELLAIEQLDARGTDGMTRKYRVMFIDGGLYPLHLAISNQWKVHYFSAAMASQPRFRDEECRFLDDMPAVLGAVAMAALTRIGETLGLEYAGIDFGLAADGRVLLFEANATMILVPPPPDPMWDYRRAAVDRALRAATRLALTRAAGAADSSAGRS
jgi:hypothetical protein